MYKASAVITKLLQNSLKHIYLKDIFEILQFSFKACKLVFCSTLSWRWEFVEKCQRQRKERLDQQGASGTFASTDIKAWLNLQKLRFVCCDWVKSILVLLHFLSFIFVFLQVWKVLRVWKVTGGDGVVEVRVVVRREVVPSQVPHGSWGTWLGRARRHRESHQGSHCDALPLKKNSTINTEKKNGKRGRARLHHCNGALLVKKNTEKRREGEWSWFQLSTIQRLLWASAKKHRKKREDGGSWQLSPAERKHESQQCCNMLLPCLASFLDAIPPPSLLSLTISYTFRYSLSFASTGVCCWSDDIRHNHPSIVHKK